MQKLHNLFKLIILSSSLLTISACSINDKHDNLIVSDGNGKKYILKHNIGDTYFVREVVPTNTTHYVQEANSKIVKE